MDFRHDFKRYRRKSPENSRRGAQTYEAVLRRQLDERATAGPAPEVTTFAEFAERWFDTYVVTNNKFSEQRRKRYALNAHLLPLLGQLQLAQVGPGQIEELKASMVASGKAPKTVNNALGVLGKCLRCAEEWGKLRDVPRIRPLRVPPQPFDYLNPDEMETLLDHAEPLIRPIVLTAVQTGLRFGELTALEWQDVDLGRRMLIVRRGVVRGRLGTPKSNRERRLPIPVRTSTMLRELPHTHNLVFPDPNGTFVSHGRARAALHRSCAAAGLRHIGWHALRHTYASLLASRGAPLRVIQQLLGHSTIQMTERYAHLLPDTLHDAAALLDYDPVSRTGHLMGTGVEGRAYEAVHGDKKLAGFSTKKHLR